MSYILDALRKSAEERRKLQEQKTQSYDPLSITQGSRGKKDRSRPLFLFICLVIGGLLAGLWFYYSPLKPDLSTPQSSDQSHRQQAAGNQKEENTVPPAQPAAPAAETAAEAVKPAPKSPVALNPAKTAAQPARQQPVPKEQSTRASAATPAPIPLLKELPLSVQAAIPEMKFSGHVFSADPRLRLIMVNTSIVREGDMITPDVKLVEITENGLVFSYRQTPFKVVLF